MFSLREVLLAHLNTPLTHACAVKHIGGCCTPVVVGGPPPNEVYPPFAMPRAVGEGSESERDEAEPVL